MAAKTMKDTETTAKKDVKVQTSESVKEKESIAEKTALTVSENKTETDVYSKEFLKQVKTRTTKIVTELEKVERSFLNIAFSIHWLYDHEGYKPLGYQNIYDLARDRFGISRGTTSNYINIVDRFAERDEVGNVTDKLLEKFQPYSSSKLLILLDLTDEEIEKIPATLSVRDMRKKVNVLLEETENKTESISRSSGKGFSQTFDADEETEEFEVTRQALISCVGMEDYKKKIDDIDDYILKAFKAHPEARIEIVLVSAHETQTESLNSEEKE